MRLSSMVSGLIAGALFLGPGLCGAQLPRTVQPWTVETAIRMPYFADLLENYSTGIFEYTPARAILPSPDGHRFAVMLRHGDLAADQLVSELYIYDTRQVLQAVAAGHRTAPAPLRTLIRRSASPAPAIRYLRWTADSSALVFQTVDPNVRGETLSASQREETAGAIASISRFDVGDGNITELLGPGYFENSRAGLSFSVSGPFLLFAAKRRAGERDVPAPNRYPISLVTPETLNGFGRERRETVFGAEALFLAHNGEVRRIDLAGAPTVFAGSLSPRGDKAVVARDGHLVMLDLATMSVQELPGSPEVSEQSEIIWVSDGTRLVITNRGQLSDYSLTSMHSTEIGPAAFSGRGLPITELIGRDQLLRVCMCGRRAPDGSVPYVYYRQSGAGWERTTTSTGIDVINVEIQRESMSQQPSRFDPPAPPLTRFSNGLTIFIRESANDPQRLVASNGRHELRLMGPSPVLRNVALGRSEVVEWVGPDGVSERGLLTLPPSYQRGERIPLVIQFYNFMPQVFRPEGPSPEGYAAQLLAAHGMAVLGVNNPDYEVRHEGERIVERAGDRAVQSVDAAVAVLSARGIADPARVGLVGFSHGGYFSFYAITRPNRVRPAAAMSWDSHYTSLGAYLRSAVQHFPSAPAGIGANSLNGGYPDPTINFWSNKDRWFRELIGFNIDRIQTPYFAAMNGLNPGDYGSASELLGLFATAHRPFELMNVPFGTHPYARPRERAAAMTLTVDWMSFWLQGQEDPDPAKREQYTRWRDMRTRWQRQQAWEAAGHPVASTPPADFQPAVAVNQP
jgi:dipeptidyl aminopeptidase/acylaminoacyl peptidase